MTGEEIEKGLACCVSIECGKCPYLYKSCREALAQDALDYITRLKEEERQAVGEFAERLKSLYDEGHNALSAVQVRKDVDELIKEIYGNDE